MILTHSFLKQLRQQTLYESSSDFRQRIINENHKAYVKNSKINGTKKENDLIINSPGCIEEAHLSLKQGNLVIPIAVTGGAASEIWDEINKSGINYSTSLEFQALKSGTTIDEVIDAVKKIINRYVIH